MLRIGDVVYIEDSGQIDVGFIAWSYIKDHRVALVKKEMTFAEMGVEFKDYIPKSGDFMYAVEWPEKFNGGHTCQGHCKEGQGQFLSAKHLDLNFEASREVNTVPNL